MSAGPVRWKSAIALTTEFGRSMRMVGPVLLGFLTHIVGSAPGVAAA